jgi:hypothetical protein
MNRDLAVIRQCLLPNEEVRVACRIRNGYLVLSNRRVVILNEKKPPKSMIEWVIPYDCVLSIGSEKIDRSIITGRILDKYGNHTRETRSIEIQAPKDDEEGVFQSVMKECSQVIEEMRGPTVPHLDLSYLEKMPDRLTRDAVLDLNTVLRDRPIHDTLVHEATKFLGDGPFLLEESLRDGTDRENGALFAAGTHGYYWVQGKKQGRYISNVIVDTTEWENIRCFVHQWHLDSPKILATYSPIKDGKAITTSYQWSPSVDEYTLRYPWLLQRLNGPWILADVALRCTGKRLPASWVPQTSVKRPDTPTPRYYN